MVGVISIVMRFMLIIYHNGGLRSFMLTLLIGYVVGYKPSLRLAGHTAVVSDYIIYVYGGYTQKNAR